MELTAQGLGTSVEIVAVCMVIVVAEEYGREGLQILALAGREIGKSLLAREKAEARAVKDERKRQGR